MWKMNAKREDMLLQDWTGDLHKYVKWLTIGVWLLVALEATKFVVW